MLSLLYSTSIILLMAECWLMFSLAILTKFGQNCYFSMGTKYLDIFKVSLKRSRRA
ncbi:Uncharacterised protein [Bacillus freudenreichii]|nr:Uncharacterised protein [Bacillus freudenreichii]